MIEGRLVSCMQDVPHVVILGETAAEVFNQAVETERASKAEFHTYAHFKLEVPASAKFKKLARRDGYKFETNNGKRLIHREDDTYIVLKPSKLSRSHKLIIYFH